MIQSLKDVVQRNFMAKVIALLVAVALWVIVMDDQNPMIEKEYSVAVSSDSAPVGYKITKDTEDIKLRVRAQRSFFANVESSDFKARLDLSGKEEGEYSVPVQVQLPQGFELLESNPAMVQVKLDPMVEQPIKAEIVISGKPASNVTIARVTQNHEIVTIDGPKSTVGKVDRVLGYVDLKGDEAEDLDLHVLLNAVDKDEEDVTGVRVIPSALDVQIKMARSLSKKVVAVKAVLNQDLPSNYAVDKVQVSPANVEIAGDDRIINAIQAVATEPISLDGHEKTFTIPAKLVLPEGITVTNPEVSVNIVVSKKNLSP